MKKINDIISFLNKIMEHCLTLNNNNNEIINNNAIINNNEIVERLINVIEKINMIKK
jgi:hypothetical protein